MSTQAPLASNSIDGATLLDKVCQLIARYLQCSEDQRAVLALWALHTHCLPATRVTPYISIQSAEKQSGKSLCLQLLSTLCHSPVLTVGFTASALTRRIDGLVSTILLDECQATLGTRARSKNPELRAILAGGHQWGSAYTGATYERHVFAPKAFAGRGHLPEDLADRSIPIILEPVPSSAMPQLARFDLFMAIQQAEPLQQQLSHWSNANLGLLSARSSYAPDDFPPNLSPRRRDMIEPLLHIADLIGGEWPARIRQSLATIFEEKTAFDLRMSVQLLADIRDCFAHHGYPGRLSTTVLLEWMQSRPARPWDADGAINARILARLLSAFDIHPRLQRNGSSNPVRGYQLQDFAEPWQIHFGFIVPAETPSVEKSMGLLVTHAGGSRIANKHAACNTVSDNGAISEIVAQTPARGPRLQQELPEAYRIQSQNGSSNSPQMKASYP
ncbi:MAG TPA: DUF3631 domain-containing protein [Candidatus Angelobacter sp.]|jgi:hypothetical protein|nr:DUF3631 domain-containing protein [Candidatus Angelobacter sp.]